MLLAIFTLWQLAGCNADPIELERYESFPASKVDVRIVISSEDEWKSILAPFADAHGYRLRIGRVHPTHPEFSVSLWRPDSVILGANPFELQEYKFGIYAARQDAPRMETMISILDELKSDLVGK
ncbi:MAG: hypothetical protein WD672_04470 [Woeseia sp.]